MSEHLKTCIECDEEKPLVEFDAHPLRLNYSRCRQCFPAARLETVKDAITAACAAKYPGKIYERVLGIVNGQSHWEKVQNRTLDTLLIKKLLAA